MMSKKICPRCTTIAGERQHKLNMKYDAYVQRRLNKGARKTPTTWDWEFEGWKGELKAFTRSEAKALLKERFGFKSTPKEVILVART